MDLDLRRWLAFPALALAAGTAATIAPAKAPTRVLVLSEKHAERVVRVGSGADATYESAATITAKATFTVPMDAPTVGPVDESTLLLVSIDRLVFRDTLESAPNWREGRTSATWTYRDAAEEGSRPPAPWLTVKASWRGTALKVTVQRNGGPALSAGFLDAAETFEDAPFVARLRFGGQEWEMQGAARGRHTSAHVTKGDGEFDLAKVTLAGEATATVPGTDFTAPTVDLVHPRDGTSYFEYLTPAGSAQIHDDGGILSVSTSQDGSLDIEIEGFPLLPDGAGGGVDATPALDYGGSLGDHTFRVTVTDVWGNRTTVLVIYNVSSIV